MRRDRTEGKESRFKTFTAKCANLYLIFTLAFAAVLLLSNLLPLDLLWKVLAAVGVIFLLTYPVLKIKAFKDSRKRIALLMSFLITMGYCVGISYMTGTMGFFANITRLGGETEEYYVLVNDKSKFEDIKDIKKRNVSVLNVDSTGYDEAREKLEKKAKVEFEGEDSLSSMGSSLMSSKKRVILLSEAHYTAIGEELKGFRKKTRIIYTIKVKLDNVHNSKSVNVKRKPFSILISGIDTRGDIDKVSRSDVNMIVTVNPKTHQVLLTSIPRDTLIKLKSKGDATDKLTHAGIYGIGESISAVEELMDMDINYYVKVNYSTVMKLVDAIGGIKVNSEYSFTTSGMHMEGLDGLNFYEGENELDGASALAFARERHSFASGDFQRNKNQQLVLEAVLKKLTSSKTLLTKYSSLLNSIEDNVETNFSGKEIRKLIKLQLKDMPKWKIKKQSITGYGDAAICYSTGDYYVSVVQADEESIAEAKAAIEKVYEGE